MTKGRTRSVWLIGGAAALLALLPACRDEEQGRVLHYKPGIYQGKPVLPLSADQVAALQKRAQTEAY